VTIRFDVNPKWIFRLLLAIIAGLTLADVAIHVLKFGFGRDHLFGMIRYFNFANESNVPSWFSSLQLALAGLILSSIAVRKYQSRDGQRFMWALLAVGFWFMSVDEVAQTHEYWAARPGGFDITRGLFTYYWVVAGIPVVIAVGLIFSRFVFTLPKRTRNAVIGSGVFYVWSAVGVEMLQALYHSTFRVKDFAFEMITVVEETGEMLAIAFFIAALMRYIYDEATAAATAPSAVRSGVGDRLRPTPAAGD
jgi:hypothetical protein